MYFDCALNPHTRSLLIAEAVRNLGPLNPDTIVCRGVSGQCVGAILAHELQCGLYVVRKPGESSHMGNRPAGFLGSNAWIVDDFICSGQTMRHILDAAPDARGIYLYREVNEFQPDHFEDIPIIRGDCSEYFSSY